MIGPRCPNVKIVNRPLPSRAGAWEDWNDNEWRHFSNSFHLLLTIWIVLKPNPLFIKEKSGLKLYGKQAVRQLPRPALHSAAYLDLESIRGTCWDLLLCPPYTNWFLQFMLLICFLLLLCAILGLPSNFFNCSTVDSNKGCFASTFYLKLVAVIEFIALLSSCLNRDGMLHQELSWHTTIPPCWYTTLEHHAICNIPQ